ncbi:hypothetical protein SEA_LITTLETOKYO_69 [Arthrobacter phage LittleTokyo]|nr:hypothetical protein SEA_LITTLETOKYO_69 [Arthrobacter phage LittleTokyo]
MSKSKELVLWCGHLSWSGAEGPVVELGRWPVLWECDSCGIVAVPSWRWLVAG